MSATGYLQRACLAAPWLALSLLAGGCTEPDALPTLPPVTTDQTWQRLYPAASAQTLRAAWGEDAADLWAVGDRGTILHHDGRRLRSIASPTDQDLVAIEGLARDAIWAIGEGGAVLFWDGRHWSIVHTVQDALLSSLCVLGEAEVMIGGNRWVNSAWQAVIWRHDGHGWWTLSFADPTSSPVRHIWQAGPDGPLLAGTLDNLFSFDGRHWRILNPDTQVLDIAGNMVLTHRWGYQRLVQVQADGYIQHFCSFSPENSWHRLAQSRALLIAGQHTIALLDGCAFFPQHTSAFEIHDLVVPAHPGPDGPILYAVGRDAGITRLTWRSDGTLDAADLTPIPTARLIDQLAGNPDLLATVDWQGRLLVRTEGAWQVSGTPWPVATVTDLDDGRLLLQSHEQQLAVGDANGDWLLLPGCPVEYQSLWLDSRLRARAMAFDFTDRTWQLWGLESGAWQLLDTLPESYGLVDRCVGLAPDDLYVLFAKNNVHWLLHHDGAGWQEVLPDFNIRRIAVGPRSGVLYLEGSGPDLGSFSGYLQDGQITVLTSQRVSWDELLEPAPGLAICRTGSALYLLDAGGYTVLPGPDTALLRRFWAHLDQGLFVVTDGDEIFHRDLPGDAP
jgi:hypothetical protein